MWGTLVAPLRGALIGCMLAIIAVLCWLSCQIRGTQIGKEPNRTPPSAFVKYLLIGPSRLLARICLAILGVYSIEIHGTPDEAARIVVSTHICAIDNCFHFFQTFPAFLSKAEVLSFPFFGTLLQASQSIAVARDLKTDRKRALTSIQSFAKDERLPPLLIYPQGTTTRQDQITSFSIGAFIPGLPVQPVVLQYPFRHFDCSDTMDLHWYYFRLLSQFKIPMKVTYMKTYVPDEKEKASPELFAQNVRAAMAAVAGVPTSEYSRLDFLLMTKAASYKAHEAIGDFCLSDLAHTMEGFDLNVAKACLKRYVSFNKTNKISLAHFASRFGWMEQEEQEGRAAFKAIFHKESPINFHDFCEGLFRIKSTSDSTTDSFQDSWNLNLRWQQAGLTGTFFLTDSDLVDARPAKA